MDTFSKPLSASEITPEPLSLRRREFIRNALLFTATSTGVVGSLLWLMKRSRASEPKSSPMSTSAPSLTISSRSSFSTDEPPTPYRDITTYNNFYEFRIDKSDPAANAHTLKPRPWTVSIEGAVRKPLVIDVDQVFHWQAIVDDVSKRTFIFVGFATFVLLIPLAVTSTSAAVKRMAYTRWKQLHRLASIAPVLGILHFLWRVKKDISEPTIYAIVLGALLAVRVIAHLHSRFASPARA